MEVVLVSEDRHGLEAQFSDEDEEEEEEDVGLADPDSGPTAFYDMFTWTGAGARQRPRTTRCRHDRVDPPAISTTRYRDCQRHTVLNCCGLTRRQRARSYAEHLTRVYVRRSPLRVGLVSCQSSSLSSSSYWLEHSPRLAEYLLAYTRELCMCHYRQDETARMPMHDSRPLLRDQAADSSDTTALRRATMTCSHRTVRYAPEQDVDAVTVLASEQETLIKWFDTELTAYGAALLMQYAAFHVVPERHWRAVPYLFPGEDSRARRAAQVHVTYRLLERTTLSTRDRSEVVVFCPELVAQLSTLVRGMGPMQCLFQVRSALNRCLCDMTDDSEEEDQADEDLVRQCQITTLIVLELVEAFMKRCLFLKEYLALVRQQQKQSCRTRARPGALTERAFLQRLQAERLSQNPQDN